LTLTPPTASEWFSRLAIQRAAALEAPPELSANTDAPLASGVKNASAWIDTNRSACTRSAFFTRSPSGTKKSESRVSSTRTPGLAFRRSRSCSAMARTTSFSCRPVGPVAPGSSPPWPGSMAMTSRRSTLRFSSGVSGRAANGAWVSIVEVSMPGPAWIAEPTSATRGPGLPGGGGSDAMLVPGTTGALAPAGMRPMNSPSASCTSCAACCSACSLPRSSASSGSCSRTG